MALAVASLLVPPLEHNHGPDPAPVVSQVPSRCTATGASPHLHPARTHLAPDCPACAAGPSVSGVSSLAPTTEAPTALGRLATAVTPPVASWAECPRTARAPPLTLPV